MLFRPGRGQVIAAVILFVVGLGAVTQLRISNADDAYSNARREDLIQILDGLGAESRRLEAEIAELEQTKSELQSGADRQEVAAGRDRAAPGAAGHPGRHGAGGGTGHPAAPSAIPPPR